MGLFLNTSNEAFQLSINDNIYIDKTNIIRKLNKLINKRNRYICVSRPRRFGKTMIAEMLNAYYSKGCDSKKIFKKFLISKDKNFEKHLNKYDVIHINIQNFISNCKRIEDLTNDIEKSIKKELLHSYKNITLSNDENLDICFEKIYNEDENCNGFIFIIDEWDAIFRIKKQKKDEIAEKYLDFLRLLLKDRIYVKLAYMTGILPIKKYGTHSALNMFEENSMIKASVYAEYFGFTEKEVKNICNKSKIDFKDMKLWYNGYVLGDNHRLYNPKSVIEAINNNKIDNYWARTETFEALKTYIELDFDGLYIAINDLLSGKHIKISTDSFQNDMEVFNNKDDVLTLLVHLGYISYDENSKEVFVPNKEVSEEFSVSLKNGSHKELLEAINCSNELLINTINKNEEMVAEIINKFHNLMCDPKIYNNEMALSSVIKMSYYIATKDKYNMFLELPTGNGYADVVYLPIRKNKKYPALLIELKYNVDPDNAISQIKNKKYNERINNYMDNMLYVGISYDKKTKQHYCKIKNVL